MDLIREQQIGCPYCGETIGVLIDCSEPAQEYVEDCQVCCQPIVFSVAVDGDEVSIDVRAENE